MYDLKLTHASYRFQRQIRAGDVISQEGLILMSHYEDGIEKAALYTGAPSSGKVLGFSDLSDAQPDIVPDCEIVTVPTAPAALIVQVSNSHLIQGYVRVLRLDNNQTLTPNYTFGGSVSANSVNIDVATGRFQFHANESNASIQITYQYALTLLQSVQRFGQRPINNQGLQYEYYTGGTLNVFSGMGELWTSAFDASQDWTNGAAITVGAGGYLSQGGAVAFPGVVVSAPSADNPLLGVRFQIIC